MCKDLTNETHSEYLRRRKKKSKVLFVQKSITSSSRTLWTLLILITNLWFCFNKKQTQIWQPKVSATLCIVSCWRTQSVWKRLLYRRACFQFLFGLVWRWISWRCFLRVCFFSHCHVLDWLWMVMHIQKYVF